MHPVSFVESEVTRASVFSGQSLIPRTWVQLEKRREKELADAREKREVKIALTGRAR